MPSANPVFFNNAVIQNLILEFLNILIDHTLKFLSFCTLLKDCPVELKSSVFQMRTPLL